MGAPRLVAAHLPEAGLLPRPPCPPRDVSLFVWKQTRASLEGQTKASSTEKTNGKSFHCACSSASRASARGALSFSVLHPAPAGSFLLFFVIPWANQFHSFALPWGGFPGDFLRILLVFLGSSVGVPYRFSLDFSQGFSSGFHSRFLPILFFRFFFGFPWTFLRFLLNFLRFRSL